MLQPFRVSDAIHVGVKGDSIPLTLGSRSAKLLSCVSSGSAF